MAHTVEDIRLILKEARAELMQKPNVIATGVGYRITNGTVTDELALICSVDTKASKQSLLESEMVPRMIQGIPTDVHASGMIYALADPKGRFRPAPGGVSIGHINITAGTLGCLVQKNNQKYILSNNHVLANSNDASIGDPILQPGPTDGGSHPADHIANLSDFIKINFDEGGGSSCPFAGAAAALLNALAAITGSKTRLNPILMAEAGENLVDCAIAAPLNPDDVVNEILNIGTINGSAEGLLGMSVHKSGRTTGHTTGTITQIDVTVQVSYGSNKTATFIDQLMAGNMSAGGDSGSAVLNTQDEIVGLLFAGSSNSTIFNRIQNVFDALNVSLIP